MKFQACIDCHIDPHKGSFKQPLRRMSYHRRMEKIAAALLNFDHSKTSTRSSESTPWSAARVPFEE